MNDQMDVLALWGGRMVPELQWNNLSRREKNKAVGRQRPQTYVEEGGPITIHILGGGYRCSLGIRWLAIEADGRRGVWERPWLAFPGVGEGESSIDALSYVRSRQTAGAMGPLASHVVELANSTYERIVDMTADLGPNTLNRLRPAGDIFAALSLTPGAFVEVAPQHGEV